MYAALLAGSSDANDDAEVARQKAPPASITRPQERIVRSLPSDLVVREYIVLTVYT